MMAHTAPSHYDVLGISRDADANDVRRAWKTLVQVWHPDRFTGSDVDAAQDRAAAINDAYSTLRDTSRRSAYDCRLAADDREREYAAEAARDAARAARRALSSAGGARFGAPAVARRGAPVAAAVPLDQQFLDAVADMFGAMRRYPRATVIAAISCVLVFVGIGVFNAMTGPTFPSGTSLTHASRVAARDDSSLEDLAAATRDAAATADDQLAQQLAAEQAAEQAAPLAEPDVVAPARGGGARAPRTAARGGRVPIAKPTGQVQQIVKPDGTRVLRIMPS
ncbi:MAG: J domain-containing protein [Thermoleophilia bacterium]|nr:J domain-containing protein [Thermoleophilia bacterium]